MKRSIILAAFLAFSLTVFSQDALLIEHNEKGFYLVHSVKPKEGLYAIGRHYAIPPQEIAAFNNMDINNGLAIGQKLMIPLTEVNFTQKQSGGKPVYYIVGPKEGLFRVSQKNGNVLMADLRKWNHLSKDVLTPGQKIIVGFLAPAETAPETVITNTKADTPVVTDQPKKTEPKVEEPKMKEEKTEKKPVITSTPPKENAPVRIATDDGNGGFFRSLFEQQVKANGTKKESTVTSGIFKTASGWQDKKYYALVDNVDPGTIVKITNPSNNKSIYAKVLGGMSGIRQNQGYDLRISNAAASVLDISDTEKFVVKLNY